RRRVGCDGQRSPLSTWPSARRGPAAHARERGKAVGPASGAALPRASRSRSDGEGGWIAARGKRVTGRRRVVEGHARTDVRARSRAARTSSTSLAAAELARALARVEFTIQYQPIVVLSTGESR